MIVLMVRTTVMTEMKQWVLSAEGKDKPADAEFLPLDSACEEHTCPWNFAEGGRDLGLKCTVEKRERSLDSSGRKWMVSHDVFGPEDA